MLLLFSALLNSSSASAEDIRLQIEGLSGALEKNVRARLSAIKSNEVASNLQFRSYVYEIIREGMRALGYYEPKISFSFLHTEEKNKVLVAYVTPGEPVLIKNVNVTLRGDARTDIDYLNLLNQCPQIGSVLNHGDYDGFKKKLIEIALHKGYFHNHFNKNHLGISLNHHQAYWDIDYDSGERFRFGKVTFEGSQIRKEYLQNIIPFKEGDYYQSSNLDEFNRRFLSSGWFSSVIIEPELDKAHKTKILPIRALLSPRKKNIIEIGTGYSTSSGLRMQGIWKKPWINSYGHSFTTSATISEVEKKLFLNYEVPLLKNPLEQYYLIKGGVKHSNINNTELKSILFVLSRYWKPSNNWKREVNLNLSYNRFSQLNTNNTTMLVYPELTISRTHSCENPMLTWGDLQRYSIGHSNTIWGSDVNFSAIQAQNIWIRTFLNHHRFIVRSNFGWIDTENIEKVPPDLRFFAIGDRGIRGHRFKSILLKEANRRLIGSSKLVVGSLEYQYNLIGKWWSVVFFDAGESVRDIHNNDFKMGIGIGVRWTSLLGPIKLDLAFPLKGKAANGLQLYLSLGPEL